jgi:hypothetical protein
MRTDTALGKRFVLLILATIFLLALFGCGGGRDTSSVAAPREEAGGIPVPAGEAPGGGVDLDALLGDGLVSAEVTGRSIDKIDIRLTNLTDSTVTAILGYGTVFLASDPSVQNMILTEPRKITVEAGGGTASAELPTACMDMRLDIPGGGDVFSVEKIDKAAEERAIEELSGMLDEIRAERLRTFFGDESLESEALESAFRDMFGDAPPEEIFGDENAILTNAIETRRGRTLLPAILEALNEDGCDYSVIQAAVWIVTDGATDRELGSRLTNSISRASVISKADIAKAREIVSRVQGGS